jgi:hypothetical protein
MPRWPSARAQANSAAETSLRQELARLEAEQAGQREAAVAEAKRQAEEAAQESLRQELARLAIETPRCATRPWPMPGAQAEAATVNRSASKSSE